MHNKDLARDYIERANHRLAALEVLFSRKSYADVVREAQEIVELSLKGLLRASHIEVPRIHDVSEVLLKEREALPESLQLHAETLAKISKSMRRDRELAFYGTEDLTPSSFYQEEDAVKARDDAVWVVTTVMQLL